MTTKLTQIFIALTFVCLTACPSETSPEEPEPALEGSGSVSNTGTTDEPPEPVEQNPIDPEFGGGNPTDNIHPVDALPSGGEPTEGTTGTFIVGQLPDLPSAEFTFTSAELDGDMLVLQADLPQTCDSNAFTFAFDGGFAESYPVQAGLQTQLVQSLNCTDTPSTVTVQVHLQPVIDLHLSSYPNSPVVMRLHVGQQSVTYDPTGAWAP